MPQTYCCFFLAALLACPGAIWAQENPGAAAASTKPATLSGTEAHGKEEAQPHAHKFWDTENICLFAGVGGARMLDYASTRHMRDNGDNEWLLTNGIVDNRPLFVGIELAGTAASIGVAYAFHRTGHHTLERWVSIAHIGVGVFGSVRNYGLKPAPTDAQPAALAGLAR